MALELTEEDRADLIFLVNKEMYCEDLAKSTYATTTVEYINLMSKIEKWGRLLEKLIGGS